MTNPTIGIGSHRFELADQVRFAELSGDFNPMHLDPVAARRLITGSPVVHGMHTLLQALERLPASVCSADRAIACEFTQPVSVAETVDFSLGCDEGGDALVLACVGGSPCARIQFPPKVAAETSTHAGPWVEVPEGSRQPMALDPSSWVGSRVRIALPATSFAADFPRSCAMFGEGGVAAIALLSRFVGMVCPGLHSIFSSVTLEKGAAENELCFEVRKFDPRFRVFVIRFEGRLRGEIKAFLRPPAQEQPSCAELQPLVEPAAFAGLSACVIGGSRGLGELTAKLVAAGGGRVTLTYAVGSTDARRVADEINGSGRGCAEARKLDLVADEIGPWLAGMDPPDAVFYFATPRIFRKRGDGFQGDLFEDFLDFYVRRFANLCRDLRSTGAGRRIAVFYPSTVFIEERPRGMTEYAMAKAAAEIYIADQMRDPGPLLLVCRRLPRLATDQTTSMFAPRTAAGTEVLLPIVREVLAYARQGAVPAPDRLGSQPAGAAD